MGAGLDVRIQGRVVVGMEAGDVAERTVVVVAAVGVIVGVVGGVGVENMVGT